MGQPKAERGFQLDLELHMPPLPTSTKPLLPRLRHKAFPGGGPGREGPCLYSGLTAMLEEGRRRGAGGDQSQDHIHSGFLQGVQF